MKKILSLLLLLCTMVCHAESKFMLPNLFSDHMVLQQKEKVSIWGQAEPNFIVNISSSWGAKASATADENGAWELKLKTPKASFEPQTINFYDNNGIQIHSLEDVLIGELWLCAGQSNMEMPIKGFGSIEKGNFQPVANAEEELKDADYPNLRYFKVALNVSADKPEFNTKGGKWIASDANSAKSFSAISFMFGRELTRTHSVPVGIINCSYGGTRIESWLSPESIAKFEDHEYKSAEDLGDINHKSAPSNVYRGMFSPIKKYTIRGVLWCQGESNRDNSFAYPALMQEMVSSWRKEMNNNFPLFYVQMTPFKSVDPRSTARLCEAQIKAMDMIPNARMVSTSDIYSPKAIIHYPDKQVPAKRLFDMVDRYVYNNKSAKTDYPSMKSVSFRDGKAIVEINNAKGLYIKEKVEFMEIAGVDKVFKKAKVEIVDNRLHVYSDEVAEPTELRYCFLSLHNSQIFNHQDLPLLLFRTDTDNQ